MSSKSSSSSSSSSSSPLPPPLVTLSTVSPFNKVKKEPPEDEIKEYAANAMSELLGWYGYEKVDSRCTRGLNLDHFICSTNPKCHRNHQQSQHQSRIIESRCVNKRHSLNVHQQQTASSSSSSSSPSSSVQSRTSQSPSISTISVVSNKESDVAQVSPPLSLPPPAAASPRQLEHADVPSDIPDSSTACSWCGRTGGIWDPGSATLLCGIDNSSGQFCSEACFAAGRRAAFKRARTCDWCRHVRHSVSYVDFQDGESQLQFCSDKCLNQYKMNIFCRETQAHLALHGLASLTSNNPKTSGGLITPELWLRDCRSPPPSSSTEDEALIVDDEPPICSTKCVENHDHIIEHLHTNNEKELLVETVESIPSMRRHTHNLNDTINDIFNEETEEAIRESLKDEEERQIQKCKAEMNTHKSFHTRVELNSSNACRQSPSSPECSKQFTSDYAREGRIYLKDVRKLLGKDLGKMCHQVSDYRSRKISKSPSERHINYPPPPPRGIGVRQPFLPRPMPIKFTPRPGNFRVSSPITMAPPPSHSLHRQLSTTNSQAGLLPPVTVLVPYPIPIPIPLPIPIPIPLFGKFFNLNNVNLYGEKREDSSSTDTAPGANIEISIVPEDLSQRGQTTNLQTKNIPKQNESINVDGEAVCFSDCSTSSSAAISAATSCAQFSTTNTTDILPVIPIASTDINSRPLRKRRRQSVAADQIDIRLKRRNKFVPV